MVHHHRHHPQQQRSKYDEEAAEALAYMDCANLCKKSRPRFLRILFIFSMVSCSLVFAPRLFSHGALPFLYSFSEEDLDDGFSATRTSLNMCSSIKNGTICCNRSSIRSDICFMKGDIRTSSFSSSIILYSGENSSSIVEEEHRIRPYTRKWEPHVMKTIDEISLIKTGEGSVESSKLSCEIEHRVPLIVFSTGGYTGNVYHEFNDGIFPLYITAQKFKGEVVVAMVEYHDWWIMKYGDILSKITNYPAIDFSGDRRTHCFPEAIVGLQIHDELTVNSTFMEDHKSIADFRALLDQGYTPRIRDIEEEEREMLRKEERERGKREDRQIDRGDERERVRKEDRERRKREKRERETGVWKPRLVIVSRNNSRAILNQDEVVREAEKIGFEVKVLSPTPSTELAKIYRALNASDVMVGVHGAAMTHFLFMKPGSVFIQVVPLGTDWAAQTYYGEPAMKMGLKYFGYKILARESSLYNEYERESPVLKDPDSITRKGWEETKRVYLDGQNVRLEMQRFRKRLLKAYTHAVARRKRRGSRER
ncbi:uncharacterized protein LOC18442774 [Amborella trichopoda]|uniref:uncharacterized protein LOC18442774 n=1 Tax=Amborella trichopoda TaxID=13333 RepID=UPI0005D2D684|nr:uncharacterized protein LOC18442774 [Amborella trichopoda]|eukprot:XP_011626544.1 uncharacterized protein LOC18442774 [Amborella trichopoda]